MGSGPGGERGRSRYIREGVWVGMGVGREGGVEWSGWWAVPPLQLPVLGAVVGVEGLGHASPAGPP